MWDVISNLARRKSESSCQHFRRPWHSSTCELKVVLLAVYDAVPWTTCSTVLVSALAGSLGVREHHLRRSLEWEIKSGIQCN